MKGKLISVAVILLLAAFYVVALLNSEATRRVYIQNKNLDNTSEFDNMWKTLANVAEVPEAKKDALKEIFNEYAAARNPNPEENNNLIMKWVQESVPNADLSEYKNLQNIVVASRAGWTMRQKELIDMYASYCTMFERIPSGPILKAFGRKQITIQIVTSTKTKSAFDSGIDDDVQLFKKSTAN